MPSHRGKILAALTLWIGATLSPAHAGPSDFTSAQLVKACTSALNSALDLSCNYYFLGYIDAFTAMSMAIPPADNAFCPPKAGIALDQARLLFLSWAKGHPQNSKNNAAYEVGLALLDGFHCH